ncbi:MAG: GGDEF domain-containing protein [Gammaproteobacteria bacterium]|nr:GGDEF domain-containing protein [Gammaproteobacteria bacterium]
MGAVIYERIARLLDDQEAAHRDVERVYGMLLRLLLDAYTRSPTLDHVNQINTKLTQLQEALALTSPAVPAPIASTVETAPAASEPLPMPMPTPPSHIDNPPPANSTPVIPLAPVAVAPPEAPSPAPAERRVNAAYRLHLDRKSEEIAKLQDAFAQNVQDAITQNREFGALLQIELSALQQAEGADEIESMRQILIGAIEELKQGQRALGIKLHKTSDYLKLIKSDSDRLRDELNKVRLLSLTDEFTGLPNRRAFTRRLQDEIGRAERYGTPLAMALLDLDEFKSINDAYGHAGGDEVLRAYAANVLSTLRHHDLVARYGGEEFAVLLPNTSLEGAAAALDKVRARASSMSCTLDGKNIRVPSFSAGLTLYATGDVYSSIIDRADRALYRAKRLGRNRFEVELAAVPKDNSVDERPNDVQSID